MERHNAKIVNTGLHFMRMENRNVFTVGGWKELTRYHPGKGNVWHSVIRKKN